MSTSEVEHAIMDADEERNERLLQDALRRDPFFLLLHPRKSLRFIRSVTNPFPKEQP